VGEGADDAEDADLEVVTEADLEVGLVAEPLAPPEALLDGPTLVGADDAADVVAVTLADGLVSGTPFVALTESSKVEVEGPSDAEMMGADIAPSRISNGSLCPKVSVQSDLLQHGLDSREGSVASTAYST
jgi:hypothetical protein